MYESCFLIWIQLKQHIIESEHFMLYVLEKKYQIFNYLLFLKRFFQTIKVIRVGLCSTFQIFIEIHKVWPIYFFFQELVLLKNLWMNFHFYKFLWFKTCLQIRKLKANLQLFLIVHQWSNVFIIIIIIIIIFIIIIIIIIHDLFQFGFWQKVHKI